MGGYDVKEEKCPYCEEEMEADYVDVGVGLVQCGPHHCYSCGASEIGPELDDWCFKDREGKTIYLQSKRKYWSWKKKKTYFTDYNKSVLKANAPFTSKELETGYYEGEKISPYANTVGGLLVDHLTAKKAYNIGLLDEKDIY